MRFQAAEVIRGAWRWLGERQRSYVFSENGTLMRCSIVNGFGFSPSCEVSALHTKFGSNRTSCRKSFDTVAGLRSGRRKPGACRASCRNHQQLPHRRFGKQIGNLRIWIPTAWHGICGAPPFCSTPQPSGSERARGGVHIMVPKFSSTARTDIEIGWRVIHPIAADWTWRHHFMHSD